METSPVQIPSREHLHEVWMQSQTVLGLAEDALRGDAQKRQIVLAAVDRLYALALEREKDAALAGAPPRDPADLQRSIIHFYARSGWPDDLPVVSWQELSRIVPMMTGQAPYGHYQWRNDMADLREATQRLGEIIGPQPQPKLTVDTSTNVATLDGTSYPVTKPQAVVLAGIIEMRGGWRAGPDMKVKRADRHISALPAEIRDRIQSEKGKGYRLKLA